MFGDKDATKDQLVRQGVVLGLIESVFVALVALVVFVGEVIFPISSIGPIIGVISLLILFVVGTGISATLVFGYPISLMLDKKEDEAKTLLFSILSTLLVVFVLLLIVAAIF